MQRWIHTLCESRRSGPKTIFCMDQCQRNSISESCKISICHMLSEMKFPLLPITVMHTSWVLRKYINFCQQKKQNKSPNLYSPTDNSHYRDISSLTTSYKILSNILLARLTPYEDEIIGDHQCGFWHNWSMTDQIFYIWQILEKKWEYNDTVHQLFIDSRKPTI
jgi:hypothetical protein